MYIIANVKFSPEESEHGLKFIFIILGLSIPAFAYLFKLLNDLDGIGSESQTFQSGVVKLKRPLDTCIICNRKGSDTVKLYIGGCENYCHCQDCFRTYQPLPQRCVYCHALLCYRKYRDLVFLADKKEN